MTAPLSGRSSRAAANPDLGAHPGCHALEGRALELRLIACLGDQSTPEIESLRFALSGLLYDPAWDEDRLQFELLGWKTRYPEEPFHGQ